ncbi:hypothetical protein GCM10020000_79060 [Streptomyces olivoverticillatus]
MLAAASAGAAPAAHPSTVSAVVVAPPKGKVVAKEPLSIRERPATAAKYLGALKPGSVIELSCKVHGQTVQGNDIWYLLAQQAGLCLRALCEEPVTGPALQEVSTRVPRAVRCPGQVRRPGHNCRP